MEGDLNRLESRIKQLKVQYDMFFAGALPHEPTELRRQINRMIRVFGASQPRKYAYRFRYNALVARFNSLSELWGRTLRGREEGRLPGAARTPPRPAGDRLVASCDITDPVQDEGPLRELYHRFLEAGRETLGNPSPVSYRSFVRGIAKQTESLRKSADCDEIELRVVVSEDKVRLKARPKR